MNEAPEVPSEDDFTIFFTWVFEVRVDEFWIYGLSPQNYI